MDDTLLADLARSIAALEPPAGERMTHQGLHLENARSLQWLTREFEDFATRATGAPSEVFRMWAVTSLAGDPRSPTAPMWHQHLCPLSAVFVVAGPDHPVGGEGAFGFLAPEPVRILAEPGLMVLFDHALVHDGNPLRAYQGPRIVVAADLRHRP